MYLYIKRLKSYGITTKVMVLLVTLSFMSVIAEILGISMFLPILDFIPGGVEPSNLENSKGDSVIIYIDKLLIFVGINKTLESLILVSFSLFLFSKIISYIITYTNSYYLGVSTRDMRRKMLRLYLKVNAEYYDRIKIGDFVNISFVELNKAINGVIIPIKLVVSITYTFVSILILLFISYKLTLLSIIILFISILYPSRWVRVMKKVGRKNSNFNSVITSFLLERLHSLRLVRLSGASELEVNRYDLLAEKQRKLTLNIHLLKARVKLVIEPLVVGISLIMIYIAIKIIEINPSEVILYLIIIIRLVPSIDSLVAQVISMNSSEGAISMVKDLLEGMKKEADIFPINMKEKFINNIESIELLNVCYKYNKGRNVINNISLTCYSHAITAIVGPSGSGKSTLVDVISNYRKPTFGSVLINGDKLSQHDVCNMNSLVSYMPQDPQIFKGTIRSHISYGESQEQLGKLLKYSKISGAYSFIKDMNKGFESEIQENGSNLSGGQRKRLDLARVLYMELPILILDEPTSGLDQVASMAFMREINRIKKSLPVIVIIITHELNLLKDIDQIVVFEDGVITGKGKHNHLKNTNKWYSKATCDTL